MPKSSATFGQHFPESFRDLLSASGKQFLERAGAEMVSEATIQVLLGNNIRTQTEPLTRQRIVREILEGLGVGFQSQAPLGHYTVDFLVPVSRLVIQADGDYWHAHPAVYGEGLKPLTRVQQNRRRLDASCDSYLSNMGYNVLRLWERDLKKQRTVCEQAIKTALGVQ